MLTYAMEQRGDLSLYEYLYQCIRRDILSGDLATGTRLPSKRALAEHLRVSVITVEGAYQQLEPVEQVLSASLPVQPVMEPEERSWRLDLKRNRVDISRFPVATWARLTRRVLSEDGEALLRPVPHQGLPALRQAIAHDLREFRGMAVDWSQILVGAGAEYLYLLVAQLLGPDRVFAVEDPGYPKIRQVYGSLGILAALAASGAAVAHLSPAHHYPTGLVTPIGRRQALLGWAEKQGGYIIEDDYDSELRFTGRPIPTLQSIDRRGRVVYMNTFSQTISPSMRLGFLVLPPALLAEYRRRLDFYACTVPALEQHVLALFLSEGHYERHLSRMRKEYRLRRDAVLEAFRSSAFAHRITLSEQGAGLHFLLHLETNRSDDQLRRRGETLGVQLGFLSEYAAVPNPAYAHTLVVNYGGLEPAALPEAMALLAEVFAE